MICPHISVKKGQKVTCGIPLAANRTPNHTQNRTCRRPLTQLVNVAPDEAYKRPKPGLKQALISPPYVKPRVDARQRNERNARMRT
jgi:hypothetical protein